MHRTLAFLLLLAGNATADTLLVVNKSDATLAWVDPATLKVTGKIATGEGPHEVAVSDDGKTAVVGNYGGRNPGTSLTVVDVAAKREIRRFELPGLVRPHGIQAIGSRFYITFEESLAVARYDAAANRIDWIGGTGQDITHMLVVARDEKKVWTSNIGSNSVSVFDLTNAPRHVALKQIAVARAPEGIDLAPDGSALWVAGVARQNEPAKISIVDPKTDSVVRTIEIAAKLANRVKFSPDGRRVAVSDPGMNEVVIFDAASGDVVKKIATADGPSGLVFTPDGKRLFVACAYAAKVQAIDTATWSIAGEVATGTEPDGLAYVRHGVAVAARDDVGEVIFANSGAAEAQAPFRRGLALLHNFEYPYAKEEFRKAQQLDPSFVMAYWGEAMTQTHPIWFTQNLDVAREILQRLGATPAERLAKAKTERERDYLAAVEVLYGEGSKNERDFKYADAMEALHARYPDDVDAAAFHALAILGTTHQGRDFPAYMRAASILEEVFPAHPRHPGVLHYLIHSYDDPTHAPLGLRAARVYGSVAPNAPHALHMTSHIFVGMGMWDDVIDANRRAVDVTNRQLAERNKGRADCGHYVTWLHYGHVQKNDAAAARAVLDACRTWALDTTFTPVTGLDSKRRRVDEYADMRAHHVASGQPLSALDLGVTVPPEFVDARYTIAYGDMLHAAQRGDADALRKSVERLRALNPDVVAAKKDDDNPSGRMRAEVMLQEGEALLLAAAGKRDEAIALLEAAKKTEEAMPVEFGPPLVPRPAAELLGDQLLAAGRAADAEAAYRSAIARVPGRTVLVAAHERARRSAERTTRDTKTVTPHKH